MVIGSLSPVRRGFNDCIDDAMDAEELSCALKDVASSSRKTSGWTTSEDEADPMHQEEGLFLLPSMFLTYPFTIAYVILSFKLVSISNYCYIFQEIKSE